MVSDTPRGPSGVDASFPPFEPTERFLTVGVVAGFFGVSEVTIKNWVDARQLLAARTVGGHRRIAASSAIALLELQGRAIPSALARGGRSAVLIDADPAFSRAIRRAIAPRARVELASDDYSALLLVARVRPEVVAIDLHLPHGDARRLVTAMRADPATRKLDIVVIGHASSEAKSLPAIRGGGALVFCRRSDTQGVAEAILDRLAKHPTAPSRRTPGAR